MAKINRGRAGRCWEESQLGFEGKAWVCWLGQPGSQLCYRYTCSYHSMIHISALIQMSIPTWHWRIKDNVQEELKETLWILRCIQDEALCRVSLINAWTVHDSWSITAMAFREPPWASLQMQGRSGGKKTQRRMKMWSMHLGQHEGAREWSRSQMLADWWRLHPASCSVLNGDRTSQEAVQEPYKDSFKLQWGQTKQINLHLYASKKNNLLCLIEPINVQHGSTCQ